MDTESRIKIIPFNKGDQNTVRELINEGLGEHWGIVDPTQNPDIDNIFASYPSGSFFVAKLGSKIVGTGALIPASDQTGQIVRMSVSSNFRRRGIGNQILDSLIRHGKKLEYKRIILETTATWDGVIKFYLAYGFQVTHYKDDDIYFELLLE